MSDISRKCKGFTIVEITLAASLLAVVLGLIGSLLRNAVWITSKSSAYLDAGERVSTVIGEIRRALRDATTVVTDSDGTGLEYSLAAGNGQLKWDATRQILTLTPPGSRWIQLGGIVEFRAMLSARGQVTMALEIQISGDKLNPRKYAAFDEISIPTQAEDFPVDIWNNPT